MQSRCCGNYRSSSAEKLYLQVIGKTKGEREFRDRNQQWWLPVLRRKTPLGDDNLREINSGDFQYSRNNDDAPQIHPQTSTADTSASFSTGPQIHPHHFFGERARRSELTDRLSCVNTISICVLFLRQISLCACSNRCGHVFHEDCIFQMRRQGGSGRCPLCRRIHADLTPLQNLHAHAHCRLDTIADLTLGRLFPKQANALLVSALYSG